MSNMAKQLRCLRNKRGLTQVAVAKEIGINISSYRMYEIGQRNPHDRTKQKIADYFNVSVQELFYS